jgi:hypothetical protein
MKSLISKFDFTKVFATCLAARLILAAVLASPRLVGAVVAIYVTLMLAMWIKKHISKRPV